MESAPVLTARQALNGLRVCYEDFVEKLEGCRASSIGEVMERFFRSQGNPKVGYAVDEFNGIITGRITSLAELLAQCPAEDASALTEQALELMLFYPIPRNDAVLFPLTAFEGHALPLVSFLSQEARQETARRYAKRTPPRRMLPNQKKLWQALSRP